MLDERWYTLIVILITFVVIIIIGSALSIA
jgi:hypothetical protein